MAEKAPTDQVAAKAAAKPSQADQKAKEAPPVLRDFKGARRTGG